MKTAICHCELINVIIDLQERGFDHDFVLAHEYICCLQYNETFSPEDFDVIESHNCPNKMDSIYTYVVYAIQLRNYDIKGILLSNHKSYNYQLSLHLWKKLNDELPRRFKHVLRILQRAS